MTLDYELFLPEHLILAAAYEHITSHTNLVRDIKVCW